MEILTKTSLLSDITATERMKYIEASYLSQAPSIELKNEIKHLIDTGIITKEIVKKKTGNKYSTFVYLSLIGIK